MKRSRFIAGKMPVLEAIGSGVSIDKIFIVREKKGKGISEIVELSRQQGIPIQFVPNEKIKRLLGRGKLQNLNHQGIIAISSLIQYQKVDDVVSILFDQGKMPFLCLLDSITDVRNLGAIARSAAAFGVDALIIPKKGSADINEFAIKASAGALEKIYICRVENLEKTVDLLKLHGLFVISADISGKSLVSANFKDKAIALILGSEGLGVKGKLLKASDEIICIPMNEKIESLNVSVAAGILFYQISKALKT